MSGKQDRGADHRLIFACSGAADVGQVANLAARRVQTLGGGRMACLAGISARNPAVLESAHQAERLLVIDGCPQNCARQTLCHAGFTRVIHLQVADLGLLKGQCPASPEHIEFVAQAALTLLGPGGP